MSQPTFIKALRAFSDILSRIPQDDLPKDFVLKTTQQLNELRKDPNGTLFGMETGQQILPRQSNMALGATFVWQTEWNRKNPDKSLWIDTHVTSQDETPGLDRAFDYMDERNRFVANQMAELLENQKQPIPDDLRVFLGGRHGSKEGE